MNNIFFLILLSTTVAISQSVTKTMILLPDTGQNISYTATFGEDNDYNINTQNFTNNNNGTITDNVTNLMWQQVDGGEMSFGNANIYANDLVFGGFADWRLPSPHEAFSILNFQNNNPALNTTFFTASNAQYWWTNSYELNSTTKAWVTNAGGGIGNKPISETISVGGSFKYHVRLVRNIVTPIGIINQFTDNNDGSVYDNLTKLTWQKVPNPNMYSWEAALAFAENLTIGSTSDWRLPNIKELQSISNETLINPSVNTTFFGSIGIKSYWSSTSLASQSVNAWFMNTQFGTTTFGLKTSTNYVICVKGSPTLSDVVYDYNSKIIVFPNPFRSKIQIKNGIGNEDYKLQNQFGQTLFFGKDIENQDFLILPNGIYFLEIYGKENFTIKLIKN